MASLSYSDAGKENYSIFDLQKAKEHGDNYQNQALKEKGVVPDSTRDTINDLVALDGVRPNKVIGVLKGIAGRLGIGVRGNASDRTVQRIVKEGGVVSQMQFVECWIIERIALLLATAKRYASKNYSLQVHRKYDQIQPQGKRKPKGYLQHSQHSHHRPDDGADAHADGDGTAAATDDPVDFELPVLEVGLLPLEPEPGEEPEPELAVGSLQVFTQSPNSASVKLNSSRLNLQQRMLWGGCGIGFVVGGTSRKRNTGAVGENEIGKIGSGRGDAIGRGRGRGRVGHVAVVGGDRLGGLVVDLWGWVKHRAEQVGFASGGERGGRCALECRRSGARDYTLLREVAVWEEEGRGRGKKGCGEGFKMGEEDEGKEGGRDGRGRGRGSAGRERESREKKGGGEAKRVETTEDKRSGWDRERQLDTVRTEVLASYHLHRSFRKTPPAQCTGIPSDRGCSGKGLEGSFGRRSCRRRSWRRRSWGDVAGCTKPGPTKHSQPAYSAAYAAHSMESKAHLSIAGTFFTLKLTLD
ncbi:hypothetical protein B0H19DRAFT_1230087 [Mycena capillaripes]|nr:hypothetical protein B0H19DRAFT_1230087 [Mycena capillaripes]